MSMGLQHDSFVKLERWAESEKRHIIKNTSISVMKVKASIERRDSGYYLAYTSPNLTYSVKTTDLISVEKVVDSAGIYYILSTWTDSKDTVYYKLTV